MGLQLLTEVALSFERLAPALDTLGKAANLGLMDVVWMDHCPLLLRVSGHARFRLLRAQVAAQAARVLAAFQTGAAAG